MVLGARCKIIITIVQFGNYINKNDFSDNYNLCKYLILYSGHVLRILILYSKRPKQKIKVLYIRNS